MPVSDALCRAMTDHSEALADALSSPKLTRRKLARLELAVRRLALIEALEAVEGVPVWEDWRTGVWLDHEDTVSAIRSLMPPEVK